jgi:hypothetical protein
MGQGARSLRRTIQSDTEFERDAALVGARPGRIEHGPLHADHPVGVIRAILDSAPLAPCATIRGMWQLTVSPLELIARSVVVYTLFLVAAFVIVGTLFVLNWGVSFARRRSSLLRRLLDPPPTVLARDGKWIKSALQERV